MRMLSFAARNRKEILRDPINLFFGLGFPIVLMLLLYAIQSKIPVSLFEIAHLTPGIAVFGLSFMTLFSATVISKDRASAFMMRLLTTPLKGTDFILGYTIPMLAMAFVQSVICYFFAILLGLTIKIEIVYAILLNLPTAVLFIAMGLFFGSIFNDKQVGGICGALLTNLCAWLSGAWFDLKLVGGVFFSIAKALPFYHAVELQREILSVTTKDFWLHFVVVLAYAIVFTILAILTFLRKIKQ